MFIAAISTAWDYFDSYPLDENATQIVIFDIDETSLSNEKPRMGEAPHRSMALLRPGQQLSGVVTSYAPALQPLLELYTELWERGFSVTFITGRWETYLLLLACSCHAAVLPALDRPFGSEQSMQGPSMLPHHDSLHASGTGCQLSAW